jgi:hypothetical protein
VGSGGGGGELCARCEAPRMDPFPIFHLGALAAAAKIARARSFAFAGRLSALEAGGRVPRTRRRSPPDSNPLSTLNYLVRPGDGSSFLVASPANRTDTPVRVPDAAAPGAKLSVTLCPGRNGASTATAAHCPTPESSPTEMDCETLRFDRAPSPRPPEALSLALTRARVRVRVRACLRARAYARARPCAWRGRGRGGYPHGPLSSRPN